MLARFTSQDIVKLIEVNYNSSVELIHFPKEKQNNRVSPEIASSTSARFVRIPREGYLQQCLGLPLSNASLASITNRYYLTYKPADPNYLDQARKATQFLQDHVEEALTSSASFQGLLETYSILSAYEKVSFDPELGPMAPIPSVLNAKPSRRVSTLNAISTQLMLLASSLRKEEIATNMPQPTDTLKTYNDVKLPPLQRHA